MFKIWEKRLLLALLLICLPTVLLVVYSRRRYNDMLLYQGEHPRFGLSHPALMDHHGIEQDHKTASNYSNISVHLVYNSTQLRVLDKHLCENQICNIYFIKVHKSGSTTLQNILYRFGINRELLFGLFKCGNGMPFPNPAHKKYLYKDMPYSNYNIVSDHAVFVPDAFDSYIPSDRRVISLLRHPLENLKSTLSFHGLVSRMGLRNVNGNFIEGFFKDPKLSDTKAKFTGSSTDCGPFRAPSYTKNAMAYHFGLINQDEHNITKLRRFVKDLDKNVSLMLILEAFDESLVLMKRQFNWSTDDIIYLPLWSLKFHGRPDVKLNWDDNQTKHLIEMHRKWSPGDYMMYDFFTQKMHHTLSQKDKDFWEEVKMFKRLLNKVKTFCKSMCSIASVPSNVEVARSQLVKKHLIFPETQWSKRIDLTYIDCVPMMLATLDYQEALRVLQIPGYCDPKYKKGKTSRRYCNLRDQFVYTFPWSMVRSKILGSKITCLKYFQ